MSIREKLIGSYRLYDWKIVDGDNLLDATLGPMEQCHGILLYTKEGYMSVWLSKKERSTFASRAIDGGTEEEKLQAYDSFHSYAGTFEIDEENETVTHFPQMAAFPNVIDKALTKKLVMEGDTIKLLDTNIKFEGPNAGRHSYVMWERIQ